MAIASSSMYIVAIAFYGVLSNGWQATRRRDRAVQAG